MKNKLSKAGVLILFLTSIFSLNAQKNIKIQKVTDEIVYVYDGFENNSLKEDSGIGWNGTWKYEKGNSLTFNKKSLKYDSKNFTSNGGSIESESTNRSTIIRSLKDTYALKGSNFYTSFLIKKDNKASFEFKGFGKKHFRYGLKISPEGSVTIRNSANWGKASKNGIIEDNSTYLVVLYKRGASYKVAVYKDGDKIPKNPRRITWAIEERSVSGVNLDKFEFELSGGSITIDEFRLGNTFNSVTTSLIN